MRQTTTCLVPMFVALVACSLAITTVSAADDSCVTKPSMANCTNYQLPNVENDIGTLCGGMGNMAGCTINRICADDKDRLNSGLEYCEDFSILKDLCTDMPKMNGCQRYGSMCSPTDSVVQECQMAALPLPKTMMLSQLITDMCTQMNMPDCSKCKSSGRAMLDCDLLQVYSDLCLSMPDMDNCTQWKTLCKAIPDWPLCSSSNNKDAPPPMRMFFHTGIEDYVLFEKWVPRTAGQYAGTWLAVFFFTVLNEVLKLWRTNLERKWAEELAEEENDDNVPLVASKTSINRIFSLGSPNSNTTRFRPAVEFSRAFFQMIEVAFSFFIMLVVMTYNVGLFFAVLCGAFVGTLLVGRFLSYKPKASCH